MGFEIKIIEVINNEIVNEENLENINEIITVTNDGNEINDCDFID